MESVESPGGTTRHISWDGFCAPRFAGVGDALLANLAEGDDLGASVAVIHNGTCVVDIAGGLTTNGEAYGRDKLQLFFSVTKGIVALIMMQLVDRRRIGLDRPVAEYWPEFAAAGKATTTVRHVLGHRAGLPFFHHPLQIADLADWHRITTLLAEQAPCWAPGSDMGYHALTYGFLAGEIIRRVTGETPGQYLKTHLAGPKGLPVHIGLPTELWANVTPLQDAASSGQVGRLMAAALADSRSITARALTNPPLETAYYNEPATWALEIPAANGIGTARAVAEIYADVALAGTLSSETIDDFRREVSFGRDRVLIGQKSRFGAGFMLPSPRQPMLGEGSFGHDGRGGSIAFAQPESGIAFAYLPNRAVHDPSPHGRVWRLISALREAID